MISLKSAKDFAKVAALCAVFVSGWEGLWLTVKPDRLAHNIPTGGYGETENVKLGETHSKEYWQALLAQKLPRYWAEIAPCIKVPISNNEMIAYTSFAYNVGSAGFCYAKPYNQKKPSTLVKLLNTGHHEQACNALMAWNHAGGREVQGLTNRRASERKLCLTPDRQTIEAPVIATVTEQPYVCTPRQAEAGECLPLLPTESRTGASKSQSGPKTPKPQTRPQEAPKPPVSKPLCRGILFWKHCI